jgi:5-methylcytosine-specific restriction endonuclease McrA
MENKLCSKCGGTKPVSEFYKQNGRPLNICKVCHNAQSRAWSKAHPGYHVKKSHAWHKAHPAYQPRYTREWFAAHPGKRQEYHSRYMERKKATGIPAFITSEALAGRWTMYSGRCWICGGEAASFDHVKPISKGGADLPCNMRPVCQRCNSHKGAKWPYIIKDKASVFANDLDGLSKRALRKRLLSIKAAIRRLR